MPSRCGERAVSGFRLIVAPPADIVWGVRWGRGPRGAQRGSRTQWWVMIRIGVVGQHGPRGGDSQKARNVARRRRPLFATGFFWRQRGARGWIVRRGRPVVAGFPFA